MRIGAPPVSLAIVTGAGMPGRRSDPGFASSTRTGTVREAGGVITQRDGSPVRVTSGSVAAGGPAVHADFMARYSGRG